jgi:hypothetical protein
MTPGAELRATLALTTLEAAMSEESKRPDRQPATSTTAPDTPVVPSRGKRSRPFHWLVFACLAIVGGWFLVRGFLAAETREFGSEPAPRVFALLHIARDEPRLLRDSARETKSSDSEFKEFQQQQAVLAKRRSILEEALKRPDVAELKVVKEQKDPVDWLQKNLHVDFPSPGILRIGMSTGKPEESATLVNAVTDAYLQQIVDGGRAKQIAQLNQLDRIYRERLEAQRSARQEHHDIARSLDITEKSSLLQQRALQEFDYQKRELGRVKLDLIAAEVRLAAQRANKQTGNEGKAAASKLQEDIAVLSAQEKHIRAEVEKLGKQCAGIGMRSIQLEVKQDEIAQAEKTLKQVAAERDRLEVELKGTAPRITVLERAAPWAPK